MHIDNNVTVQRRTSE